MNEETGKYLRLITDMLNDDFFTSSYMFLTSVRNHIMIKGNITENHKTAIDNIYIKFSENE